MRIKVVGVGGGGSNAVTRMGRDRSGIVELACVNTDVQALEQVQNAARLAIGWRATGGFGSGGDPALGRLAAEEDTARIKELVEGADLVFVTAGLGGGTGTGAAPVVASLARQKGALTVGVASWPFSFEGDQRAANAVAGLKELEESVDSLLLVDNDRLASELDKAVSFDSAFAAADEVLARGVRAVIDTVTTTGFINVDFADIKAIMRDSGRAHVGSGEGRGDDAASDAVREALRSPFADVRMATATRALVNVAGGADLSLAQVDRAVSAVRKALHPKANIIMGIVRDPGIARTVRVTLIATGLSRAGGRRRMRRSTRSTGARRFISPVATVPEIAAAPPFSVASVAPEKLAVIGNGRAR